MIFGLISLIWQGEPFTDLLYVRWSESGLREALFVFSPVHVVLSSATVAIVLVIYWHRRVRVWVKCSWWIALALVLVVNALSPAATMLLMFIVRPGDFLN